MTLLRLSWRHMVKTRHQWRNLADHQTAIVDFHALALSPVADQYPDFGLSHSAHEKIPGECRWGNTLSKKLFKGKEYVLKHIRVKHALLLEEQVNAVSTLAASVSVSSVNIGMH